MAVRIEKCDGLIGNLADEKNILFVYSPRATLNGGIPLPPRVISIFPVNVKKTDNTVIRSQPVALGLDLPIDKDRQSYRYVLQMRGLKFVFRPGAFLEPVEGYRSDGKRR